METLWWIIPSSLFLFGWLAYHQASRYLWIGIGGAYLLLVGVYYRVGLPAEWSAGVWSIAGLYTLSALLASLHHLRKICITRPIMTRFRSALPALSKTEKEALEAGTVWWDRELFSGQPNWDRLLTLPKATLSAEEQAFLQGPVERLCQRLDDWQITSHHKDLPVDVWDYLKKEGFFGLVIDRKFGGRGFSAQGHSAIVAKIASRSVTAAVTVMVPNSLGPAELLHRYGTTQQQEYYLPRLADGREVPCFALTGPNAGSDAGSMPDRGVVVINPLFQGKKEVLGIRLNWNKRYITLGPVATLLGLAFKLEDPDHLLGQETEVGITLALIPTSTANITIGSRHDPLGIPFQNGPTQGTDVFIPMEWIIGGPQQAGNGWRMLMDCLSEGRAISLPALSTGAAKTVSRVVGNYARIRKQFNLPIGRFEGVAEVLGHIAGQTYLMEAARSMTALAVDLGEKPSVISALTKYQLTERMRLVVNNGMDLLGGAAISQGPKNLLARIYQSIPIGITVEGANILTRTLIIFGQGAVRAHPFLLEELNALSEPEPKKSVDGFDRAFFNHIGFVLSTTARTFWLALCAGRGTTPPGDRFERRYFQQLSRLSAAFALVSDIALLTFGGSLKRREMLSGRLADVLSHLYLGSAILKQYHDQGRKEADRTLVNWGMAHNLFGAEQGLSQFLANYPYRPIVWALKVLIFPWGRTCTPPTDNMVRQAADLLLEPSESRNRLTAGIFLPDDPKEPMAKLEEAFRLTIQTVEMEKKWAALAKANPGLDVEALKTLAIESQVLSSLESRQLDLAHELCDEVIQVDDFSTIPPIKHHNHLEDAA
ncbi:MAG: acyl-CoA dehydrogenase [Magnetococcales bacterium]|nr:acyl-CoA dehydrogenase [Magnetococcales bacterium]